MDQDKERIHKVMITFTLCEKSSSDRRPPTPLSVLHTLSHSPPSGIGSLMRSSNFVPRCMPRLMFEYRGLNRHLSTAPIVVRLIFSTHNFQRLNSRSSEKGPRRRFTPLRARGIVYLVWSVAQFRATCPIVARAIDSPPTTPLRWRTLHRVQ